jgi:NADH-quinone oxidoreductase subunit L
VSALLQTIAVAGGVVLLMRMRSILVPDVLQVAAIIGGVTALAAALVAIAQRDARRVLAWSTISQVGLMFVGAGVGALFAARFQLIAHALLKAVLVLGVGSVRRATGDESDLARFGGLGRRMRWTAGAVGIGTLALVGIPPAAGFFGIAAIVSAAFSESDALLTALVLLAAAASAFAGVRLFTLIFVAPPAVEREAHEPPRLQDVPLALLAVAALGFGAVVSAGILPIGSGPADEAPLWLIVATFAIVLTCSTAAWLGYRHGVTRVTPVGTRIEGAIAWARGGLGVDALYVRGVAGPFAAAAREVEAAERANDGAIDGVGSIAQRVSRLVGRARPRTARAEQALLLAGTVALLAFWTWSAR